MGDIGPLPVQQDAYHVEAEGIEIECLVGQVLFCHKADCPLFAWRYRFEGGSVGGAAAEFYLDDDEGVYVAEDQVEFTTAGAVVALHDLVPFADEVAAGDLLAEVAGGPVVQAPTPA